MSRTCGGCTKCCEGWLTGEVFGHSFYRGRPCFFLNKECSIYETRPKNPCRSYKCSWLDSDTLPQWMRPDLSNAIVNKCEFNGVVYYALVEAGAKLDSKVLSWMIQWALTTSSNLLYYIEGGQNRIGSAEFMEIQIEP